MGPRFRELYEAEFAWVARTLRRLGVREADVEDVAHDLFVVVHRRIVELEPGRPLRPWLFGIAYRVVGSYFQRAHRKHEVVGEIERADDAPAADERLASEQARTAVLAALEELELDQRAVCVLHDLDGLAAPEIARVLDIPLNTVYSRLRTARLKVAAALRRGGAR